MEPPSEETLKGEGIGKLGKGGGKPGLSACRYGIGCTHTSDPVHRARYWHPPIYENSEDLLARTSGYVCNECGIVFEDVTELQLHMQRKTAWSNTGLVGCRVSCLIENREWQESVVLHYHRSGKHCLQVRSSGDKIWLWMQRTAFYILERSPPNKASQQECKELVHDPTENLAPIEEWTYCEDISVNFVIAQSLLHRCYGSKVQETGHKTTGHVCVTEKDRYAAKEAKGSLLYGELLPRGINKAFAATHLNAAQAKTVYDLGMGTGKVVMQGFLQMPHLHKVYGVELSEARYLLGEKAVFNLLRMCPGEYKIHKHLPGKFVSLRTVAEPARYLEMEWGNLFDVGDLSTADVVLLETDVASVCYGKLSALLSTMPEGARALTYLDLSKVWQSVPMCFKQMEVNSTMSDRFPTSWSVHRGHHFFLWEKVPHGAVGQEASATGAAGSAGSSAGAGLGLGGGGGHSAERSAAAARKMAASTVKKMRGSRGLGGAGGSSNSTALACSSSLGVAGHGSVSGSAGGGFGGGGGGGGGSSISGGGGGGGDVKRSSPSAGAVDRSSSSSQSLRNKWIRIFSCFGFQTGGGGSGHHARNGSTRSLQSGAAVGEGGGDKCGGVGGDDEQGAGEETITYAGGGEEEEGGSSSSGGGGGGGMGIAMLTGLQGGISGACGSSVHESVVSKSTPPAEGVVVVLGGGDGEDCPLVGAKKEGATHER